MTQLRNLRYALCASLLAAPSHAQAAHIAVTPLVELKGERTEEELISPNQRFIAYIAGDDLRVLDVRGRLSTTVMKGKDMGLMAWSPASDAIAFVRDRDADWKGLLWSQPIDPATGKPRGAPQRVAMTRLEDAAAYSPDGKRIAFFEGGPTPSLRIVPATGGKEQVVTHMKAHADVAGWAPDGKSLLVLVPNPSPSHDTPYLLQRVSVDNGATTSLLPVAGCTMSSTGGKALLDYVCSNNGHDSLVGITSFEGKPLGIINMGGEFRPADVMADGRTLLMRRTDAPMTLETISTTDGTTRALGPLGREDRFPRWSPDGRRIGFIAEGDGRRSLVIMNADGSARREIPAPAMTLDRNFFWSPNGQLVAWRDEDGMKMKIVDVATMKTVATLTPPDKHHFGGWRWRSDSRAIIYADFPKFADGHSGIREAALDGSARVLRDLEPWAHEPKLLWRFVNDSLFLVHARDSLFVVPVAAAAPARAMTVMRKNFPTLDASPDGRWIAIPTATPGKESTYDTIELIATADGTRRMIPLPFEASTTSGAPIYFLPDGNHLLLTSAPTEGNPRRLWSVPLNGEPARAIGVLATSSMRIDMDLSPDGRTLVFTRPGTPTTTYGKADYSTILKH